MTTTRSGKLWLAAVDAMLLLCVLALGTDKFLDEMGRRDMLNEALDRWRAMDCFTRTAVPTVFIFYLVWAHTWRGLAEEVWSRFLPVLAIVNVVPSITGVLAGVILNMETPERELTLKGILLVATIVCFVLSMAMGSSARERPQGEPSVRR